MTQKLPICFDGTCPIPLEFVGKSQINHGSGPLNGQVNFGPHLQRLVAGVDRLGKIFPCFLPFAPFSQSAQRVAKIVLRPCPVLRQLLVRPHLERVAAGLDRLGKVLGRFHSFAPCRQIAQSDAKIVLVLAQACGSCSRVCT